MTFFRYYTIKLRSLLSRIKSLLSRTKRLFSRKRRLRRKFWSLHNYMRYIIGLKPGGEEFKFVDAGGIAGGLRGADHEEADEAGIGGREAAVGDIATVLVEHVNSSPFLSLAATCLQEAGARDVGEVLGTGMEQTPAAHLLYAAQVEDDVVVGRRDVAPFRIIIAVNKVGCQFVVVALA